MDPEFREQFEGIRENLVRFTASLERAMEKASSPAPGLPAGSVIHLEINPSKITTPQPYTTPKPYYPRHAVNESTAYLTGSVAVSLGKKDYVIRTLVLEAYAPDAQNPPLPHGAPELEIQPKEIHLDVSPARVQHQYRVISVGPVDYVHAKFVAEVRRAITNGRLQVVIHPLEAVVGWPAEIVLVKGDSKDSYVRADLLDLK